MSNAGGLGTNLRQLVETDHVVVDLAGVSYMDSTGVSALIAATKHAANSGTSMRVAGATRAVMLTLQIVGVDTYLGHKESVADAIAATQTTRKAESPPPNAPARGEAEVSPTSLVSDPVSLLPERSTSSLLTGPRRTNEQRHRWPGSPVTPRPRRTRNASPIRPNASGGCRVPSTPTAPTRRSSSAMPMARLAGVTGAVVTGGRVIVPARPGGRVACRVGSRDGAATAPLRCGAVALGWPGG